MSATATSPTAPAPQQIPIEKIREYVNANVPVLPLSTDGKQDVRNLFTFAELDALRSGDTLSEKEKSEVFETEKDFKSGKEIPVVHYLKLLAKQTPVTFWSEEKIKMQQWHGIACLTGLTSIPAPSDKTKVLIIIGIDADDYRTRYILEGLVKQCGLLDKTIVQETAHKGMHVLIAVAVDPKNQEELETWRKRALLPSHCKDCKIEIKTTTMQITLDPSKHRIDKTLSYTRISNVVSICEYRDFYDLLIQRLQLEGCLRCTPEEYHARQEKQEQSDYDKNSSNGMADRRDQDRKEFTETELANGVRIILGVDEDNLRDGSPFGPVYYEGGHVRYLVSMALAGHLFWHNITSGHAKKLIEKLEATCSNQKLNERLKTVTNVYKSGWAGKKIIGQSGLIDAFKRAQKDNKENETLARQRLEKLNLAFGLPDKKPKRKASDIKIGSGKLARLNEADLIVDLARRKIRFMFMNHLKQPLAVIQVQNHCEIMDMRDKDADFAGALRQIWREENIAQNNSLKSTIPEDMLRRAQLGLIADLRSLERAPIETHLRVAWKVKDKVLRYDLTNALWQQVEISTEGVKIIDSKTILDDITQYENSGFAEDKMPIFFQRYASKPQVLPVETFDQNIFDRFINELTNVTDTRAHAIAKQFAHYWKTEGSFDNRTKSLLAKVGIISKLIPDIPRFLETVFGNSGSMKTSYLRFEKRLIDPGVTELNNPNISRRDIQQRYAHNHYIIIDNATQVDKWFSDFICSVISGTGGEDRELFTTQGIVNYSIKCCVSVSGINRIFTETDAVNRSLNFEFLSIDVDSPNYKPESVVYAQFEEMRPQLLAYMFDTVSKAIKIKQTWPPGKYKLGRMADIQEWGEAISQAMGYKEREFLNAHKELELIQHRHASKADPLIVIYEKLFYDLFETENILSAADRKKRYVVYDSKVLSEKLNKIAEEEGYKTGKENKLWPKDSQQLAERTREISMNLLNTSNISVDIRKRKDTRNNEFILGYPDAVKSYMQGREVEEKTVTDKVKDYRDLIYNECVTTLQERNSVEIEFEDLIKQASIRSDEVSKYIDGKFQLQDTRKLQPILEMLQNHQYIEQTSNKPFRFRWLTPQVEDNPKKDVYLASNTCTRLFDFPKISQDLWQKIGCKKQENEKAECMFSLQDARYELKESLLHQIHTPEYSIIQPSPIQTHQGHRLLPVQVPTLLLEQVPELRNFATFDCEWHIKTEKEHAEGDIYCFCLINSDNHSEKWHINQFGGDRYAFLNTVLDGLNQYDMIAGYSIFTVKIGNNSNTFNSDLEQLKINCEKVGLSERFATLKARIKILDAYKIFSNRTVKGFLNAADDANYREDSLDAVATAYLGEGKLDRLSGVDAESLSTNQQLEYCLQDAELVMRLLKENNFELLQILYNLSQEIGLDFFAACNAGGPSQWWSHKLESVGYQKVSGVAREWIDTNTKGKDGSKIGIKYTGGFVFEPKMGRYLNSTTYDVSSMYPTMCNIHNISSETICCECCKDDPSAKIPVEVMRMINLDLKTPRPWHYWICHRRGILADIMKDLVSKKEQYKHLNQKLKEKAVKLFANSGYGTFAQAYFRYYDVRVTELITGFARATLQGLAEMLKNNGAEILYGDTDSLFVSGCNAADDIIARAKDRFDIKLSQDKSWQILFLLSNKKQYVGLTNEGELDYTTLIGMKSNVPHYFNEVTFNLVSKEYLELFINDPATALARIVEYVRFVYRTLEDKVVTSHDLDFIVNELAYSNKSSKPIYNFKRGGWQADLYKELLKDNNDNKELTDSKCYVNKVYRYWKVSKSQQKGNDKTSVTMHPENHLLNLSKYKEELFTCIEPLLEVYGLYKDELNALEKELVNTHLSQS